MKYTILSLLLITSLAQANPNYVVNTNAHFDQKRKLILPDKFWLDEAVRFYDKKRYNKAFKSFKKAAAFGNTVAFKYVGVMLVEGIGVEQDLVAGYAWIKLASKNQIDSFLQLEQKVKQQLYEEELIEAEKKIEEINVLYGEEPCKKRRSQWSVRQKKSGLGSRLGSQSVKSGLQVEKLDAFVNDYSHGVK